MTVQNSDHAGIAEDVADRIGHRDVRDEQRALLPPADGQSVDRVGRRSHRGALAERARQEPRRKARIEPQHPGRRRSPPQDR